MEKINPYSLIYQDFDPKQEGLREALCTLGNGYFATRGAAEETWADGVHYPGTYLAGGYNRLPSKVKDRTIINEDLVNFPNWLPLTFRIDQDPWFHPNRVQFLKYVQELKLKEGLLVRMMRFKDAKGRISNLVTRRFVHMAKPHYAGIEWNLVPENWSGRVTVRSGIDGGVENKGVARYRKLNNQHLKLVSRVPMDEETVELVAITKQSEIEMAIGARTRIFQGKNHLPVPSKTILEKKYIGKEFSFPIKAKQSVRIEKVVSIFTSRDPGISEPTINAQLAIKTAPGFERFLANHIHNMKYIWEKVDIDFKGHPQQEAILRLHIFHILQTVSPNTIGLDVGVPARGLHGEAYRGHIFWDELFIFPIFNFRYPQITRSLLLYRYHRLDMARILARHEGYHGAMFPWQSGSDGSEETQKVHLNPKSQRWLPDKSHLQRHVSLAIAFNIWSYFIITDDISFLETYGAEMFLEIARFWSSVTTYNPKKKRYEIKGVMGPDEYHEEYPNAKEPGLNNNAYTNIMVVWLFRRVFDIINALPPFLKNKALEDLRLTPKEYQKWKEIPKKMFVPMHDGDIISQFEGYEKLKEFDWEGYRKKYKNIERLDRILEAEGDSTNHYKVSKQADVTMLFFLLSYPHLKHIFRDLGYPFNKKILKKNIDYYHERTSHGSTLSKIVHASIFNRINRKEGWEIFNMALISDVADVQGGTTPEGIHLGAMAGTVDIVLRDYTGLEINDDCIYFDPQLPSTLEEISFQIKFRRYWVHLVINHHFIIVGVEKHGKKGLWVSVRGKRAFIKVGTQKKFSLKKG